MIFYAGLSLIPTLAISLPFLAPFFRYCVLCTEIFMSSFFIV